MTAKVLKFALNLVPDDALVVLGDGNECVLDKFRYDSSEGVFRFLLDNGFCVVQNDFVETLFEELKHFHRPSDA